MLTRLFYVGTLTFLAAFFVYPFLDIRLVELFYIFFLILVIVFLIFFKQQKVSIIILYILLFLTLVFIVFLRYYIFEQNNKGDLDNLLGQKIKKELVVVDEPEKKGYYTKLITKIINSKSKAILWVPNYPEFNYGDRLLVEGYLLKPKNFKSEHGREFDYISYLKKDGIFYEIKAEKIIFIETGQANFLKYFLFKLKNTFLEQIKKILPSQEASFLGGLLLGAKEDMGKELLEDFRRTGVIHIVVLSGFNLTLVAMFFMKIFAILGLRVSTVFGSIAIVLFTIMTGASATIVRAAMMALLVIFAKASGKTALTIRILFLVAFLMLMFNPMLLVYDPSFQLSFLATLGLLMLSPLIETWLKFIPKTVFDFRGILAATLSTQVFVFPLLLYLVWEISIISPLVNILILIFIPLVMLLGFFATLLSFLSIQLAIVFAFIVYLILSYNLWLVKYFSNFSFATWDYALSIQGMFFIYCLYFLIYWLWKKKINMLK